MGGGVYTATGLTVAQANTALDDVQFTPTDNSGPCGNFTTDISVDVDDQGGSGYQSVLSATTVTITRVNDDPSGSGSLSTTSLDDNAGASALFDGLTVDDVDTGEADLVLRITLSDATAGTISGGGFSHLGGGVYTATGLTVAQADTALDDARFTPTDNSAPSGNFSTDISVDVDDQGGSGYQSVLSATTVTITRVNDDPSGAGSLSTTSLDDNAGATELFDGLTVADADQGESDLSLTLTLSDPTAGDISGGGLVETFAGSGVYVRTGLTVAQANAALDVVQFTPTDNTGSSGDFSTDIGLTVNDQGGGGEQTVLASTTVTVTRVNDAPVLGNNALTIAQGGTVTLDSSILAATDADDPDGGLNISVSNVRNGWFALNTDTATPIVSFTQAQVTAGDVVFVHDGGELAPSYEVSVGDGQASTPATAGTVTFSDTAAGVLWLSTDGDSGAGNGVPGLDASGWDKEDILQQAGPNFAFGEAATDGTFSIAFDPTTFGTDADVNGLHFVSSAVTIGSGANAIDLQAGDLLLTVDGDGKTFASNGAAAPADLTVDKEDIFYFRPDKAGDYSAGNFYAVLSDPFQDGANIQGLTLVESDVWVGDRWLREGDLLLSSDNGGKAQAVWLFETGALDPADGLSYPGAQKLIEGTDAGVDIDKKIYGIDILEQDTTLGGQNYDAGTILIALGGDDDDGIGATAQLVDEQDIAALTVHKTTLGAGMGQAEVDAVLLFDGDDLGDNDVNFDSGNEALDGLSLTPTPSSSNTAPVLGNNSFGITEGQTVTITAAMLSASDAEQADSGLSLHGLLGQRRALRLRDDTAVSITGFTQSEVTRRRHRVRRRRRRERAELRHSGR